MPPLLRLLPLAEVPPGPPGLKRPILPSNCCRKLASLPGAGVASGTTATS